MIMAAALLLSVGGCSLAKKDAGEQQINNDRLIGAFLTTEYIDLFDMEDYLNDHIGELADGETITVENSSKYKDKLYATVDKKDSKNPEDWEVTFAELQGVCFFHANWESENGEAFGMLSIGDEICDVTQHLNMHDQGESISLTGKMYALAENVDTEVKYYFNPVYQTESGEIYLRSGNGHHVSGDIGGSFSMKLEEEKTITIDGESEAYAFSIELCVEILQAAPKQIMLHCMDKNLQILHSETYAVGKVPTQYIVPEETACVIVETEWADGEVTRAMYEQGEDGIARMEVFYPIHKNALGKQAVEVIWK